jgi:probable selenium-dependent hydroxylase accessory protein YqeC
MRRRAPILFKSEDYPMFSEPFAFNPHTLVNFVGGGGKTALIRKLMQEYSAQGTALYTATTRIHPPDPRDGFAVISSDNVDLLKQMLDSIVLCCPNRPFKLAVTRHYLSPTLLRGVPPDFDNTLDRKCFPILLNEADGAAGFSLKMPKDTEPVLMHNADYLVPVIGIDCLDRPLGPEAIFRWETFAEHFPSCEGERLTPQLAADILMHTRGVCRDCSPGTKIIPFINKVDAPEQDAAARDLAQRILQNSNFPVERVLFGSVLQGRVFIST